MEQLRLTVSHFNLKIKRHPARQTNRSQTYLYPTARVVKKGERLRLALMNADMNNTETLTYPNGSMQIFYGKGADSTIMLPTC